MEQTFVPGSEDIKDRGRTSRKSKRKRCGRHFETSCPSTSVNWKGCQQEEIMKGKIGSSTHTKGKQKCTQNLD
jgi:hypothetical protein